jgi:transcriptional regulator with PAS, ATPase and Fis domain
VYRTGRPHVDNERPIRLDRTGEGHLDEVYFTFIYQPLKDGAGVVEGIFVLAVDVSMQVLARRHTEDLARQLQRERDRMQQILEVLPAGVVILDAQGRIATLNRTAKALVGRDLQGLAFPEVGDEAHRQYRLRRGWHTLSVPGTAVAALTASR